jgi:hypothetical protein
MTPYEALFGRKMRALPSLLPTSSDEMVDELALDLFDLEQPTDENAASTSVKPSEFTGQIEEEEEGTETYEDTALEEDGNILEIPEPLTPIVQETENFQGFLKFFDSSIFFFNIRRKHHPHRPFSKSDRCQC